ncbi:SlyX family protein [Rhodobaculum claviforme]|uniref:Glycosyltransferase, catalytic subunit of cellulose synthase and poly-beta-1,6-N-acetylglucosamine synthase n=1 Tax=Rhodobaculum claviforme TaxID=1549854 RepID=A0A934TIJ2_9RHOB|nr:SlyX family protein [Rhodobaculum claviforme]MBK5926810.1 hypothetical protein [Rhodobaculum claviforme]
MAALPELAIPAPMSVPMPTAAPVSTGRASVDVAPQRTLGQVLLERGAVDAPTLMQALESESRGSAELADVLLREGVIDPDTLVAAQSLQWGAEVADLGACPPDPRLVDRFGVRACVRSGLVPWRRAGPVVVVVTARPDAFARQRPGLEAALGPVVMALAPEPAVQMALRQVRGGALQAAAETRAPLHHSCRGSVLPRLRLWVLGGLALLAVGAVVAPVVALAVLTVWALTLLVLFTALKLAASVATLRARAHEGAGWDTPRPIIARLPVVSVLVALHGEREIAPRLVRRLGALAWPRGLLDVILVLEEDDHATRTALAGADLPPWMRVLAVPPGGVRTKPRALNYALDHCRGSIIGVLDAEDAPDPDQIHQIVRHFHARGADVACLQGVLGYYNAAENWLSRCFAVEYAVWFRMMLPGLARLGLVVPLGGTTVYFRREALEKVGAWDAHNVTEDADLGLRLARHGYRTEVVATETGEEATCRPLPWVRQRSRWTKGFAVTYATHMRNPRALWRDLGAWRFFGVQVLFLSTLSHALLAPVLWSFWALALGLGHPLAGPLGAAGLVALAALFVTSEVIGIAIGLLAVSQRRGLRWLRPWVPTLHVYHPLATLAALKALWEVVVQPVYWDKTAHGRFDGAAPPAVVVAGARRVATPQAAVMALARTPSHPLGHTPPDPHTEPPMTSRQQQAEERLAHLERLAEDLSDEIARQSRQLAAVERQLARLTHREAQREAEAGAGVPLADQRPPHW